MCNLYRLDAPANQIAAALGAAVGVDPWAGGYVAPGKFGPVAVQGKDGRRLVPRLWGVPPPRSADGVGRPVRPVTNVRNLASPFWIGTLRHAEYRCLVPVTAFQEWGAADPVTGKRPQHWFSIPSQPVFAFAGIWRDVSEVPVFAFLTTDANAIVGAVHPKAMPVILHPEDYDRWLTAEWRDAQALVEPFPTQLMMVADRVQVDGSAG